MAGAILLSERIVRVNVVLLIAGGAIVYGLSLLALQTLWKTGSPAAEAMAAAQGGAE
jgi:hypothetical protein